MENDLDFDLTIKEVPVKMREKDKDGKEVVREYVLREANGEASARYRSAQAACTDLKDGQPVKIHGIGGLEPLLVSLCLFEVDKDKDGVIKGLKPVPEQRIRSWPQRVQATLYRKAIEISELGDKDGDAEKKDKEQLGNERGSSTDGSDSPAI